MNSRSMMPNIFSGDKIILQKIHNPNAVLLGEIYEVVTDDFRMIRKIHRALDDNHWLLVPSNPNFDTQEIAKDKIRAIFKLLGIVRTF